MLLETPRRVPSQETPFLKPPNRIHAELCGTLRMSPRSPPEPEVRTRVSEPRTRTLSPRLPVSSSLFSCKGIILLHYLSEWISTFLIYNFQRRMSRLEDQDPKTCRLRAVAVDLPEDVLHHLGRLGRPDRFRMRGHAAARPPGCQPGRRPKSLTSHAALPAKRPTRKCPRVGKKSENLVRAAVQFEMWHAALVKTGSGKPGPRGSPSLALAWVALLLV